jgi:hypothetical protein
MDPRTCTRCGHEDVVESCPTCLVEWENRRDVADMTKEERAGELRSWTGIIEIAFDKIHQRAQELVGRPVLTHEFAQVDYLVHEVLTGDVPTFDGILAKLPERTPVVVVHPDGTTEER